MPVISGGDFISPGRGERPVITVLMWAKFYLSIQNPLNLDNETGDFTAVGHFLSWAQKPDAIGALTDRQKDGPRFHAASQPIRRR